MSTNHLGAYIFGGALVFILLLVFADVAWRRISADPERQRRRRKKERSKADALSGTESITFCDLNPYDPQIYKVSTMDQRQRGKLKKSKWAQIRKAREKENRK